MKKEKLLTLLGKNGNPYSKIRPDLSSRSINNSNDNKRCNLISLSGFGTIIDLTVIILILLSLTYLFFYARIIVYDKNWMNHGQRLEGEKLVYLERLHNGLEEEDFNNPGINICKRENFLKDCDEETIKWKNDVNSGRSYEKYFGEAERSKNIRIPYHKEIKMIYNKCLSSNFTYDGIFLKITKFLNEMEHKYGLCIGFNNSINFHQTSPYNFLNLTKMIADMKIFYNIDSLIYSSIELDTRHKHESSNNKVHGIFTIRINKKLFSTRKESVEEDKIYENLKHIFNDKFSDDEYHQLAKDIYNFEKAVLKDVIKRKDSSEIVKLSDIRRRWNIFNIHSYINYLSRFNGELNRNLVDNKIEINIENPKFLTKIDNIVNNDVKFKHLQNYILYKGVSSFIEMYNQTRDSFYCSTIIGIHLPVLDAQIINKGISYFDKDSMEILGQKYVYTSYNSIIELLSSLKNVNEDVLSKIKNTFNSMRILCGAPRWISNDVEIYKFYKSLPISEEETFDKMIEKLNKLKEVKKLDGILGNITVDEFIYSDGVKLSKSVYYCSITNTIYLSTSSFQLMLKSFNDAKVSLNNIILSQIGYELGKVIIPYKDILFNNISSTNEISNYKNESYCLNHIIYSNKKKYIKEWEKYIFDDVMRHMIAIQSSYSVYNNYVIVFQNEYLLLHYNVGKDPKKFEDFYFFYEIKEYLCTIDDINSRNIIIDLLSLMQSFQVSRLCYTPFNAPLCLNWLSPKWFKFPIN
uniref:Peptidase_M13_N domain-containing protein n=1 Tax=Strongyloides venezuelensis TaxID=75913 RepID=A0A0K0EX26_STRVS